MVKKAEHIGIESWWRSEDPIDGLEVMWIGQAGFLLRTGDVRIVIDPYLSDSLAQKYRGAVFPHIRMMPVPIAPDALGEADLVLITHDHTDHLDPGTLPLLCAASEHAAVVVPRYSLAVALERGVPAARLVTLNDGESWRHEQRYIVWAIPAAHEELQRDSAGNMRFLGYLLQVGDFLVYHSGDTVPCEELESRIAKILKGISSSAEGASRGEERRSVDLTLMPVNGRDENRRSQGVPGNLTMNEAIAWHEKFSFQHTIVHHFGMFDFNTAEPRDLRDACRHHDLTEEITVPEVNVLYRMTRPSDPSTDFPGRNR